MTTTIVFLISLFIKVCVNSIYVLITRGVLNYLQSVNDNAHNKDSVEQNIINAVNMAELADARGFKIKEHVVTTEDGYLLVIHKLEKYEEKQFKRSKVAYFHHGLLTNSELFILGDSYEKNLPFLLLDQGYDVWLGNNRGNKYSRKHLTYSISQDKFWDFSLDEYALYDIPDIILYILSKYSPDQQLTYIGFSQGCSQLFACLSLKPWLNTKINLFVGLSPAIVPISLKHPIFQFLVKESANDTNFLYFLFGNRALLPSVSFWSYVMGPALYEKVVNFSLKHLFGWKGENISAAQRAVGYPHMFSDSSVRSLIHWFQIIKAQRFQMFDETCSFGRSRLSTISEGSVLRSHQAVPFPISHHLNVPMILFYGDSDLLVNIEGTKKLILEDNLNMKAKLIDIIKCNGYEHMDTLWADDVYERVFSKVIAVAESASSDEQTAMSSSSTLQELILGDKY